MVYSQVKITAFLKKNIKFTQSGEVIGKIISKAMLLDEELKAMHKNREYKYVYNNLYPVEKTGIYEEGRVYIFNIRSFNKKFISKIKKLLSKVNSEFMRILAVEENSINQKYITELYTMTPVIVTVNNKPWLLNDGDLMFFQKRLQDNLEKKYKEIFGQELDTKQSFIQGIEILNEKPMVFQYKGIKLLGNKVKIVVNEDEQSQKLAFIATGMGLGEKGSSVGAGYCHAHYL
ncbi:CRISPR-associated endoribonuclease Cas6 [Clostridium botulinum]|uniref:CRISPR-associated endoribonuclease Cas6 n=1 Tax=Clostridium botulinum TaxID=1491 RepID=UPI00071772A3|nr:CRISPR-associated endoribonuclease Cas6 [Clostridium botulinum]KRU23810.1 CRISPR-associated endoribonuclease Cas6 [Clostridium sporogenes]KRU26503.1 CRISPR-associated endoribonuclease Cas6 [Clostridium sporogenes]KRU28552.1 CRISPR-associated endoribonuclease Cas6 [Clostridium sporogenes]KRU44094.1 CRISPR-associated endoribonuclease Cas6 [Clostridium sporogenes]MBZ1331059.1 CRISPR-associated endoribonuclease Cas6 [Clostridium botulinum]